MKDKILAKLFEGFDASLLNDELKEQVNEMVEELVNERVAEATKKLEEKEAKLKEFVVKLKNEQTEKEQVMNEVCSEFARRLSEEQKEKEQIMEQALVEYQEVTEKLIAENISEFRDVSLQVMEEEYGTLEESIKQVALEQLAEYKAQQEAVTAKEVDAIKMELVEKISSFIDKELENSIPKEIMESAVKVAAYEPLVESMIKTFGKGYINFDGTGETIIREAKEENTRLSESLSAKVKDNVRLAAKVRELERSNRLATLTEGMTRKQKDKMTALLEKHDLESLEEGFNKFKDIVIEQSVKQTSKQETNMSNKVRSRVEKLQENAEYGHLDPELASWKKSLDRELNSGF